MADCLHYLNSSKLTVFAEFKRLVCQSKVE